MGEQGLATTFASLTLLLPKYMKAGNWALVVADIVLYALAIGVVVLTIRFFAAERRRRSLPAAEAPAS